MVPAHYDVVKSWFKGITDQGADHEEVTRLSYASSSQGHSAAITYNRTQLLCISIAESGAFVCIARSVYAPSKMNDDQWSPLARLEPN